MLQINFEKYQFWPSVLQLKKSLKVEKMREEEEEEGVRMQRQTFALQSHVIGALLLDKSE